jgi:MYXO-CTERM domain-containing protein
MRWIHPRRPRGIAEELIAYLIALVRIIGILAFVFVRQRAEKAPTVVIGPGTTMTNTGPDSGSWAFGLGVVAALVAVAVWRRRQQ